MEELESTGSDVPEENAPSEAIDEPAQPGSEVEPERAPHTVVVMDTVLADDLLDTGEAPAETGEEETRLRSVVEALVYVAEDPVTVAQMAASLDQPGERIQALLDQLIAEYDKPEHGFAIKEVAGGYRMATKPEHHEAVRAFAKSLKPPLKLSLPALETLAVIAYKQPVTAPEIKAIRGVQGAGVLNTLLERKLIAEAGRKNVVGKPILYKTTKDFLVQFGLKDLSELPTLKEFEEMRRLAMADTESAETEGPTTPPPPETVPEPMAESAAESAPAETAETALETAAQSAPEEPAAASAEAQAPSAEPASPPEE